MQREDKNTQSTSQDTKRMNYINPDKDWGVEPRGS
jgi:hypothetical protein